MIDRLLVRLASGGKRPSLNAATFKAIVLSVLPFIGALLFADVFFHALAGGWDVSRAMHNSEELHIPGFVVAPIILLMCLIILFCGVVTSGWVLRRLKYERPYRLALRASLTAWTTGLTVAYAAVWLPKGSELAVVLMVIAYMWTLLYDFQYRLRAVVGVLIAVVGLAQLVVYTVPNYRYMYATGDVYLPSYQTVEAKEFYSPIVGTNQPYQSIPGVENKGSLTNFFGLLPGEGLLYSGNGKLGGPVFYQARANDMRYDIKNCPNILNWEEIVPSKCQKIGKNKLGGPIYSYGPSLPSGVEMGYTVLNGTLVVVKSGFMSGPEGVLEDINALEKVPAFQVDKRIKAGKTLADAREAQITAEENARNTAEANAYKSIPFQVMLPKDVPAGWSLKDKAVRGNDPEHVTMIQVDYGGKDKYIDWVTLHIGRKEQFKLDGLGTCGPTPQVSEPYLPCGKVPGEETYNASYISYSGDFLSEVRYQVVGDLVVISLIHFQAKKPGDPLLMPQQLRDIRDALTKSYAPVSKDIFKGTYYSSPIL